MLASRVRQLGESSSESLVPVAVADYPQRAAVAHAALDQSRRLAAAGRLAPAEPASRPDGAAGAVLVSQGGPFVDGA